MRLLITHPTLIEVDIMQGAGGVGQMRRERESRLRRPTIISPSPISSNHHSRTKKHSHHDLFRRHVLARPAS